MMVVNISEIGIIVSSVFVDESVSLILVIEFIGDDIEIEELVVTNT
jgi:hypothetical protein